MKRFLNKKIVGLGLILLAVLFIFPIPAHALFGIDPIGIAGSIFSFFSYIISYIFGLFFMLGGWLVGVTMDMNVNILGTNNTLVSVGWSILRDVANLGFVLIMIVIAVTTIIRYESGKYGTKMLPVLIGAAILVNFSLTIAGVFINFSNTVSNIFLINSFGNGSETTFNPVDFGKTVSGAFNPQRMLLKNEDNPAPPDPASQAGGLSTFSTATLMFIAGLIFNIVFMAIATFSLFVLALMLLYRYIYLSIILVLAPLAYLFWAFPDLKGHFSEWWSNFLKWVFFLPAVTFFSYLAVKAAETLGKSSMTAGAGFEGSIENIMSNGIQMVLLAGLMLGGIIVAQKLGIEGASGAMKIAKNVGSGTLKYVGNKTRQAATTPLRAAWGKKATEALQTAGQNSWYGKILGAPLRGVGRRLTNVRVAQEKKVADAAKKLPKDLREQALMAGSAGTPEQVAIMNNVAKERNDRKKKQSAAQKELDSINAREEAEISKLELGDTYGEKKIREKYKAEKDAAKDKVDKTDKSMEEIEDVLKNLPKNIREGLKNSITIDENGKETKGMNIKNVRIGGRFGGYVGRRYGYRPEAVEPGKSDADKVLEAAKKALEEGEGGDKPKSEPKKEEPEKKEDKK